MPTQNPRVNVTLSPTIHGTVEKLAKLQRVSKSMVLRELLEASEPALAQVVAMMEAANEMSIEARASVARDLDETINRLEAKGREAMQLAAGVTSDLVAQAEAISGRRPARTVSAARPGRSVAKVPGSATRKRKDPPASNRGVKP
jgi:hypothetical protein